MAKFQAGDVIDFEYNGTHRRAIVLNASYRGHVHVLELNRLSRAEKQQFYGIIYPYEGMSKSWFMKTAKKKLKRRPNAHIKSPVYFYANYIGPLARDKRCYRILKPGKMKRIRVVTDKIRFDKSKPAVGFYRWMKL